MTTTQASQIDMPGNNVSAVAGCSQRHDTKFLIFIILPVLTIIISFFVLLAVLRSYRKLVRRNHVYIHVCSNLCANLLFGILALIQILCLYFNIGGNPNHVREGSKAEVQSGLKGLWTFYKGLLCGMFLVMSGNIGLLIDSIRNSTIKQLRLTSGYRRHSDKIEYTRETRCYELTYTKKATLYVVTLWIAPFIYVATALGDYNCSHTCTCLTECFPKSASEENLDPSCSRVFPPMKNIWLLFTVILWSFGGFFIFYYLKRSSTEILNIQRQLRGGDTVLTKQQNNRESTESPVKVKDSIDSDDVNDVTVQSVNGDVVITTEEGRNNRRHSSLTMTRIGTRFAAGKIVTHHLKYVLWLSISFLTFTAPSMILFLIDIISPGLVLNMIAINFCLCTPFVYCYLCPFILVKCLPGVKSSLSDLCFTLYSSQTRSTRH